MKKTTQTFRISPEITLVSPFFDEDRAREIIDRTNPFLPDQHLLYDTGMKGRTFHLNSFFSGRALLEDKTFASWISKDILEWLRRGDLEPDVLMAPDRPHIVSLIDVISKEVKAEPVYLEVESDGRLGDRTKGTINRGDEVFVFNDVCQDGGSCIVHHLPDMVEQKQAEVVGAGALALGKSGINRELQQEYLDRLYVIYHANVTGHQPDQCPAELPNLRPWMEAEQEILNRPPE